MFSTVLFELPIICAAKIPAFCAPSKATVATGTFNIPDGESVVNLNFFVPAGRKVAIVGESGAGKSTLMKTLYGMHQPDDGTITVNGHAVQFKTPTEAIAAGIGMVHQHFMLADNLTIIENIILGAEPTDNRGRINFGAARERIEVLMASLGATFDPGTNVSELGVGQRQRVEILKDGASSIYGSDAVAGVINIITDATTKTPLQTSIRYGTYNTIDAGVNNTLASKSILSLSVPTKKTVPASTASGLSVVSLITKTGFPKLGASSLPLIRV